MISYGNKFWHGAKIYVGNNTVAAGNEFCGLAGAEYFHTNRPDLYDLYGYDFDFQEAAKVGGSVACPAEIGPSQYVVVEMTKETCEPIFCSLGIFSCYCSNYRATRSEDDYPDGISLSFVTGTNQTTQQLS